MRKNGLAAGLVVIGATLSGGVAADTRPGGDLCASAYVIPQSLPFSDSRTTTGYSDDYDAACPWASNAPDVVYALTPPRDMQIDVLLCDSAYDTKLFVFRNLCEAGGLVACNDDACGADGLRSQLIALPVVAGDTYFIVVDGYAAAAGPYTLTVRETPQPPACPAGSLFSQPAHQPADNWVARPSESAAGDVRFENFTGAAGPIHGVRWWGFYLRPQGFGSWAACEDPAGAFTLVFRADHAGQPGPVVATYTVTAVVQDTGLTYGLQNFPLRQFTVAPLTPPLNLVNGWVGVRGEGAANCWFLWLSASGGDAVSFRLRSGTWAAEATDLGLCLLGGVPNTGACCYENGTCALVTRAECIARAGDLNCDGLLNFDDIDAFVLALGGQAGYEAAWPDCRWQNADCNGDGSVDFDDIDAFVSVLSAGHGPRVWLGVGTSCTACGPGRPD